MSDIQPFAEQGNWTAVHNVVFDAVMPRISDGALRVLLFVIRQTHGYHRKNCTLSYPDIKKGTSIRSDTTVSKALKELCGDKIFGAPLLLTRQDEKIGAAPMQSARYAINRKFTLLATTAQTPSLSPDITPKNEVILTPKNGVSDNNPKTKNGVSITPKNEVIFPYSKERVNKESMRREEENESYYAPSSSSTTSSTSSTSTSSLPPTPSTVASTVSVANAICANANVVPAQSAPRQSAPLMPSVSPVVPQWQPPEEEITAPEGLIVQAMCEVGYLNPQNPGTKNSKAMPRVKAFLIAQMPEAEEDQIAAEVRRRFGPAAWTLPMPPRISQIETDWFLQKQAADNAAKSDTHGAGPRQPLYQDASMLHANAQRLIDEKREKLARQQLATRRSTTQRSQSQQNQARQN